MAVKLGCIAGEKIHAQWDSGRIAGEKLGARHTPFGESGEIFLIEQDGQPLYLLPRYGVGMNKVAPRKVNHRANMYALKDLGVECVMGWGSGGAITHSIAVGDLVILSDVIDRTYLRHKTFFEDSPLGFLRQFPVFCPSLRRIVGDVLHEMKLVYHGAATAAVSEGPRLETPAEIRMLATIGAEIVTHTFVPEVFLAKELQLCYAGICYVVNYAETGSRHRPFAAGDLFGGLTQKSDTERLAGVVDSITQIASRVAAAISSQPRTCECNKTMSHHIDKHELSPDFHQWFT